MIHFIEWCMQWQMTFKSIDIGPHIHTQSFCQNPRRRVSLVGQELLTFRITCVHLRIFWEFAWHIFSRLCCVMCIMLVLLFCCFWSCFFLLLLTASDYFLRAIKLFILIWNSNIHGIKKTKSKRHIRNWKQTAWIWQKLVSMIDMGIPLYFNSC